MDQIWQFFEGNMVKAICKYQLEEDTGCESASYVESVLCEAVKNEPTNKAILHFGKCKLNNIIVHAGPHILKDREKGQKL